MNKKKKIIFGGLTIILIIASIFLFHYFQKKAVINPNKQTENNKLKEISFSKKFDIPADKWFKNFEDNIGKTINYNGLDIYISSYQKDEVTNNLATKETFDNIIDRLKELGINNKDNRITLTSKPTNPIYKKLLVLEIESKDKEKVLKEMDKVQKTFIDKVPLKQNTKKIIDSIYKNEKNLYRLTMISPGDYYNSDMLGIKKEASGSILTGFDFFSANQILDNTGKIITQNTGKFASPEKILNMANYLNGEYNLDEIYTLSSFFMLYPDTTKFIDLLKESENINREFIQYTKEMIKNYISLSAISKKTVPGKNILQKKTNEAIKKENEKIFQDKENARLMIESDPENFYNTLTEFDDDIIDFVKKHFLTKEEKELIKKNTNEVGKIMEKIIEGKKLSSEEKSKMGYEDEKGNITKEFIKVGNINNKILRKTEEMKYFLKNFHKFYLTYLLYEDLEYKELYELILGNFVGNTFDNYATMCDRPYFNYDAGGTLIPFIFDFNTDTIISHPQNDTIDLTSIDYDSTLMGNQSIKTVVKESPVCKRIKKVAKKYNYKDSSKLEILFSCNPNKMLFNYGKTFYIRLYSRTSQLFNLISDGNASILNIEGFSTLVKLFPDVFYWKFDKPEQRKAFYNDYMTFRKTGEQIYTLEKYHSDFQTFADYNKMLDHIKIITNTFNYQPN